MAILDKFRKKEKKQEPKPVVKEEPALAVKPTPTSDKNKLIQAYQVIKEPHITEKATYLTDQDKYVFKVLPKANKVEVKKAVESLYGVKVAKVHMVHLVAKKRRLGRHEGYRQGLKHGFKKAVVTLKKGEKIELLPR